MLHISKDGIDLIKQFEGCQLRGYICPAGVPTIGYGYTGKINGKTITTNTVITQSKAEELLKADLQKFENSVSRYNDKYNWTQNEFDALVSFAYNVGSITQLTRYGTRTKAQIATAILSYNKAGGKILPGLTRRRTAEHNLFIKSKKQTTTTDVGGGKTVNITLDVLKSGSKGDSVKALQILLIGYGYSCGLPDGEFGAKTTAAVKRFQISHNLVADGIVGKGTWLALLS